MKEFIYVIAFAIFSLILFSLILFSLILFSSTVFAFGEVAGPVVFNVTIGGNDTENWGLLNSEPINVSIRAEGDGAQYVSFPQSATLLPNSQVTWIKVTANIPSDYNGPTNITGSLYALTQGQPGQVQINLQMKKNFYILVQQDSTTNQNPASQLQGVIYSTTASQALPSQASGVATSQVATSSSTTSNIVPIISSSIHQPIQNIVPAIQQATNKITGFVSLAQFSIIGIVLGLIVLVSLIYFMIIRKGVNK